MKEEKKSKKKNLFQRILWRIKLASIDIAWYQYFGNCLGDFPPSFYYTHTEEEIKAIEEREDREFEELIEQLKKRKEC